MQQENTVLEYSGGITIETLISALGSIALWVSPLWLLIGILMSVLSRGAGEPFPVFWVIYAPVVLALLGLGLLIVNRILDRLSRIADAMESLNKKVK